MYIYSVFPAEACETIGGTACDVEMFPEVKLQSQPSNAKAKVASTEIDRDYLEYNEPRTWDSKNRFSNINWVSIKMTHIELNV